ncbi:hypothetical protein PTKIN_Ptkin06aG0051200 [Pterospermum kingtungense]
MARATDYSKIDVCNIMRLKWMSFVWRKLTGCSEKKLPRDVPPGHLAVTVGDASRRFIIKADYLNQPALRHLLDKLYEDYGPNKEGPLAIPCDECLFRDIIHSLDGRWVDQMSINRGCEDMSPLLHGSMYDLLE